MITSCQREAQASGTVGHSPLWDAMWGRKSTRELYKGCMQVRGYHQPWATCGCSATSKPIIPHELERGPVHAVAEARRLRAVVEDVAEVTTAAPAVHLGANHAEAPVPGGADTVIDRRPEAGPPRAAVELGFRREERQVAARAVEGAATVFLVERARAGVLGPVLAEHSVLLGRQRRPPLRLDLDDLEGLVRVRFRHSAILLLSTLLEPTTEACYGSFSRSRRRGAD